MTAAAVIALVAGDRQNYANTAAALALTVGAICLICWVARLGFLANLLSHPVLIGYMAGIAGLMIVSQLGKVTGISVEGDSVLSELRFFVAHLGQVHLPTLLVAVAAFALLVAFQRFLPRWPGPLMAMVLAAVAVAVFDLDQMGVKTVGSVPRGLPPASIPRLFHRRLEHLATGSARCHHRRLHRQCCDGACLRDPAAGGDRRPPGVPGAGCGQPRRRACSPASRSAAAAAAR